jgi:hypothetical protein
MQFLQFRDSTSDDITYIYIHFAMKHVEIVDYIELLLRISVLSSITSF